MFGKQRPTERRRPTSVAGRTNAYAYRSDRSRREETVRRRVGGRAPKSLSWLHQMPTYLALTAIIASLLYCLSLISNPKIIQLSANQATFQELRSSSVYQTAAMKTLSRSLFNHSKLTIDTEVVSKNLMRQFPEISDVYVNVPLIDRRPVISLRQAEPKLLLTTTKSETYVLDVNGRAIMMAKDLNKLGSFKLPTVIDLSRVTPKLNSTILPKDDVAFIGEIIAQLQAKHLAIQSLTLPTGTEELQLRQNGVPYLVKFNMAENAKQQAGTFLAVKGKLDHDNIIPKEYIDIRVPERAYYK